MKRVSRTYQLFLVAAAINIGGTVEDNHEDMITGEFFALLAIAAHFR